MTTGARFALYVLTAGLGLAGLGLVVTAWVAAALVDWAVVWRDRGLMVLNEWPWPILWPSSEMINTAAGLALAIGVTCLVLATGLARRREWARRATVTMLLALFLLWLAHWPAWLLLPPRLPGHTMTTWLVGILLLLLHTFAMGALNHPAICRQFLPEGAATQ